MFIAHFQIQTCGYYLKGIKWVTYTKQISDNCNYNPSCRISVSYRVSKEIYTHGHPSFLGYWLKSVVYCPDQDNLKYAWDRVFVNSRNIVFSMMEVILCNMSLCNVCLPVTCSKLHTTLDFIMWPLQHNMLWKTALQWINLSPKFNFNVSWNLPAC